MDILLFLSELPLWLLALIVVVIPSLIAMFGPFVVRQLFDIEAIAANNEVAGFKFATLGVVYAVLLGLAVISVWEKFADADAAATEEAAALVAVDRLAGGFSPAEVEALRRAVGAYAHSVVSDDWPAMATGKRAAKPLETLNSLYAVAIAIVPSDERGAVLLETLLTQLDRVTEARRTRLNLADGILPDMIWLVLSIGAALTVGFTFFFGLENLRVQMLMTGMLALLIFLALFVALSIDHPFTGPAAVEPTAIERLLSDFHEAGMADPNEAPAP